MSALKEILDNIGEQSRLGNRRVLTTVLRNIMEHRMEYYREGTKEGLLDGLSDAFFKILLLEMDEEEEDSIEMAELTYLSLGSVLKQNQDINAGYYKRRLFLLHYFGDYFTDSIIEVFLKKYRTDNLLQARNLAMQCLEKMQVSDMIYLEENEPDFINRDEQLADACNAFEINPDLSDEEKQEAMLLHDIMYAYLKAKYKN